MKQESYDDIATLYLVSTPIGNMEDMTYRSVKILEEVSVIFSEGAMYSDCHIRVSSDKNKES